MSVHRGDDTARDSKPARSVLVLARLYGLLWVITAVAPHDRSTWLLENLLVFGLVAGLIATCRTTPLSTTSYVLIFVFLSLHALGAHYTYSGMPLGLAVQEALGTDRNHYDRVVHFAFGLLFAYPVQEVITHAIRRTDFPASLMAVIVILALSSAYELIEWWVALLVSPEAAYAYLGTQGDLFDSQKDTTLALAGAVLCQAAVALRSAWKRTART